MKMDVRQDVRSRKIKRRRPFIFREVPCPICMAGSPTNSATRVLIFLFSSLTRSGEKYLTGNSRGSCLWDMRRDATGRDERVNAGHLRTKRRMFHGGPMI